MPKIAILFTDEHYRGDYSDFLARNLTEWTEVTDEQLAALTSKRHYLPYNQQNYTVLEAPKDQEEFIKETAQTILDKIEKENIRRESQKTNRQKKMEENKRKRELKALAKLKEKYEKEQK
jgi:hypothetical protein